ncbi:DUF7563 family protein [Halorarum salinum]
MHRSYPQRHPSVFVSRTEVFGVSHVWPGAARPAAECRHCGEHVPEGFRRVFGDEQGRAHRCPNCDSNRLHRGSAAGREVDVPDPETSPGRNGGEPA